MGVIGTEHRRLAGEALCDAGRKTLYRLGCHNFYSGRNLRNFSLLAELQDAEEKDLICAHTVPRGFCQKRLMARASLRALRRKGTFSDLMLGAVKSFL